MKNIYFICPHNKFIAGGVKQLYRQVDILNKNGFNAFIVHKKKFQKANWIEKCNTKIIYNRNIFKRIHFLLNDKKNNFFINLVNYFYEKFHDYDLKNGILVFPEIYGPIISEISNQKYIIYNQNCYYTFENYSLQANYHKNPYNHPNLLSVIINSNDGLNYLSNTFKINKLHRIILGIDTNIFNYKEKSKKQIAYMPRKLNEDVNQVINILKIRNNIVDWEFVAIENMTESCVAEILKESSIFLSFSFREGLGLPPLEAMACGCVVVGYHGNGGKEFFRIENSINVEDRNIIDFVLKVENTCNLFENNIENFHKFSKNSSKIIQDEYTYEIEERSTLEIYNKILK